MRRYGEKPYYSFDYYLQQTFGEKVYKLSLNGGMTCPNRDGTISKGGCIFCSAGGSGDFAAPARLSVTEQIEYNIERVKKRFPVQKYIAYFQAYTNTYASVDYLRPLFEEAIAHPKVAALSVATRPDCLEDEKIVLLKELNQKKPVWVELGLQTIHEDTAAYIRRGYRLSCFEDALRRLKEAGLSVIVHVILGLPGEDDARVYETIQYLNEKKIDGIKLQLLHVLKDTDLALDYEAKKFEVLDKEHYTDLVVECIARLSPDIVIHRLTGDGPADLLIAPLWSQRKMEVLNLIHHKLKEKGVYQGVHYGVGTDYTIQINDALYAEESEFPAF